MALVVAWVLAAGCAATAPSRPVLYPNDHYRAVGGAIAERDIDVCLRRAAAFPGGTGRGDRLARDAATGALIGAASGGAWGAIRGDAAERALAGAAAGGAGGMARGAIRSKEPAPTYRGFVQRCLREQGYDVIGWR